MALEFKVKLTAQERTIEVFLIEEVWVIFEGRSRVRWRYEPSRMIRLGQERPEPAERVAVSVWPDQETRHTIQLGIRLMRKTLVIFDGTATEMVLSPRQVPRPLQGLVVGHQSTGSCALSVVPLTWLPPADRQRGMEFLTSAMARSSRPVGHRTFQSMLVEDALIGSGQPLRFAFRNGPIGLDELQATIRLLFAPGPSEQAVDRYRFNRQLPPDAGCKAA